MERSISGRRGASTAVLVVLGGMLAAAVWVGGDHGLAVGLVIFYALAGAITYAWSGARTDVAAVMRGGGDERQKNLDREATAFSGQAMGAVAIAGAIVQSARGNDPFAYALVCTAGGLAYIAALGWLRNRR